MPDIVIEPNLLLNLAGLRQPVDRRKYQESRQRSLAPPAAPYVDLHKGTSRWTTEDELRSALQATENVNGLLLKQETDEAQKVTRMVDGMLSKAIRFQPKPALCAAERQACTNCLKSGPASTDLLLRCSKYVDAYESCVAREA